MYLLEVWGSGVEVFGMIFGVWDTSLWLRGVQAIARHFGLPLRAGELSPLPDFFFFFFITLKPRVE